MSKYTKEEQEFLDKAAIAYMQGKVSKDGCVKVMVIEDAYVVAKALLTERKKLFGDNNS